MCVHDVEGCLPRRLVVLPPHPGTDHEAVHGPDVVVRADDRTDIFVKQADGTFRATYGVRDTLVEYAPGRYRLTDREGVQVWFESPDHHYVTRIVDRNGGPIASLATDVTFSKTPSEPVR